MTKPRTRTPTPECRPKPKQQATCRPKSPPRRPGQIAWGYLHPSSAWQCRRGVLFRYAPRSGLLELLAPSSSRLSYLGTLRALPAAGQLVGG